jgi:hypothetical protein
MEIGGRSAFQDTIPACARKDCEIPCQRTVPLSHASAKGERMHSSCSFLTSAVDGDKWSALRLGRALTPGKDIWYPLDRKLGGPQSWSGHRR